MRKRMIRLEDGRVREYDQMEMVDNGALLAETGNVLAKDIDNNGQEVLIPIAKKDIVEVFEVEG